jgi:NAD(P)-dependent dehydrogenase (short-subunit alcohol dehydrogenase family)
MKLDYSNRHVVVTGGTGALGAAVVERLLEAGAAMVHIPAHRAPEPAKFALARHECVRIAAPVDLASEDAVRSFYRSLPSLWASIHTAGGFAAAPITETSLSDFRQMIETNAVTGFLCCREAVRKMRSNPGGGGRIVNVAAKAALFPAGGLSAYAASKAAVTNLTLSLSEELAAERIWVNAVLPSIMDTPANRAAMAKADFAKWPTVAEVAATIVFLASPQNAVTRGALVPVYGQS